MSVPFAHTPRPARPGPDASGRVPAPGPARPLRIAICGEVRSGKSTLLNALMRGRAIPDNLGAARRPVIRVRHGAADVTVTRDADGHESRADGIDPDALGTDAAGIDLTVTAPHLEGIELIEVPLTRAEELTEAERDLVAGADALVWVTIASQAWRLTEKTLVDCLLDGMEDEAPSRRILAVSRGDKLRSDGDRTKLGRRLSRETSDLFEDIVFLDGAPTTLNGAMRDRTAWDRTGAPALLARLLGAAPDMPSEVAEGASPDQEPEIGTVVTFAEIRERVTRTVRAEPSTPRPSAVPADAAAPAAPAPEPEPELEPAAIEEDTVPDMPAAAVTADLAPHAPPQPEPETAPPSGAAGPEGTVVAGVDDPLAASRAVAAAVPELTLAGLVSGGRTETLSGDADRAAAVGPVCAEAHATMVRLYDFDGLDGAVEEIALTAGPERLLIRAVGRNGDLLFVLPERGVTEGRARTLLTRIAQAVPA